MLELKQRKVHSTYSFHSYALPLRKFKVPAQTRLLGNKIWGKTYNSNLLMVHMEILRYLLQGPCLLPVRPFPPPAQGRPPPPLVRPLSPPQHPLSSAQHTPLAAVVDTLSITALFVLAFDILRLRGASRVTSIFDPTSDFTTVSPMHRREGESQRR